jgi:predicted transcriptional regulator
MARSRSQSKDIWPLEALVRAQCMACEGRSIEEIAHALGRSREEVRQRLDPEPAPTRQEFAGIAYRHLKRR